jgi:hypothetical protein
MFSDVNVLPAGQGENRIHYKEWYTHENLICLVRYNVVYSLLHATNWVLYNAAYRSNHWCGIHLLH